jgi:hypothetical protein
VKDKMPTRYAIKDKAFDLIPRPQIDSNIVRTFFRSPEKRLGFNERLFAPHPQFRDGDALAAVTGAAKTSLATSAIQREAGDHV